ncbi:hypothetical protein GL218_00246 [Daldinia childiae]|uniref:uncharacterized protein n=1 Tax=Daldinia childiae TaxID=326645 RepID=UPI001445B21C|nr:uncharacterized protein GL218_00246 [Daldinia childiae]KAF3070404.1 hypothetical protein GL218_00246 [Daldinia childiae]
MSLASPTSKDGFSYAGDLFAEASGHNRHRRATVAELKDHFKSGSEKDHPAHWFEAQLIHYGLQVSKTKAVARMRLFDAVNAGNVSVPAHIKKLESELKKEWIKKEREAKKAFKDAASSPAPKTTGTKRKAESSNVDVTVSVGGINVTVSASNSNKKAKTPSKPAAKKTETKPKAPKAATTPKVASTATTSKTTASRTTVSKTTVSKTTTKTTAIKPPPAGTARRGGTYQGPSRKSTAATSAASTPQPARAPQFAIRGRGQATRGRGGSSNTPSPVKREYSDNSDDDDVKDEDSDDGYGYPSSSYRDSAGLYDNEDEELKPLGLLNGRYVLTSEFVTSEWGHINFSLVFTLSGTELWGRFDLGIVSGVMRLPQRPWQSSTESLGFTWRGQELEGPMIYGDYNRGSIRFLGDGKVKGELDWMGITFEGSRVVGQGTRSEVDMSRMRAEWEGYNEDEYERENRNRW